MRRRSVWMVILVLSNGLLTILTVGSKMTSRNHEQRHPNTAHSDHFRPGLNIDRPSWFSRRDSGINQIVDLRRRHRMARSQIIDPGFTSLFIPENKIYTSADSSENSQVNPISKPDIAFDEETIHNLVEKDASTQKKAEIQSESQTWVEFDASASKVSSTHQELGSSPTTFEKKTTLKNSSQSSETEQTVKRTSRTLQTPFIVSDSFQTDSDTNQNSASTIDIEQSQNTSIKARNFEQNAISDNQRSQTLSIINQSLIGRLYPAVTQSGSLMGQHSFGNSQSESITDHSNIDNSMLYTTVDQKVVSHLDHLVTIKGNQGNSPVDETHLNSSVSQFLLSTQVNLDANILSSSSRTSKYQLSPGQNQSKTIPHQLQTESRRIRVIANQSATTASHLHVTFDQSLVTSIQSQISTNRMQKDTLQPNDIMNQSQTKVFEDTAQRNYILNQSQVNVNKNTLQPNDIMNQSQVNVNKNTLQPNDIMNQSQENIDKDTMQSNDIFSHSKVKDKDTFQPNIQTKVNKNMVERNNISKQLQTKFDKDTVQTNDIMNQSEARVNEDTDQPDENLDQSQENINKDTVQPDDIMNQSRAKVNKDTIQPNLSRSQAKRNDYTVQPKDTLNKAQTKLVRVSETVQPNDIMNQSRAIVNEGTVKTNDTVDQSQAKVDKNTLEPNGIMSQLQSKDIEDVIQPNDILNQTQENMNEYIQTIGISNQPQTEVYHDTLQANDILNQTEIRVNKVTIQPNDILKMSQAKVDKNMVQPKDIPNQSQAKVNEDTVQTNYIANQSQANPIKNEVESNDMSQLQGKVNENIAQPIMNQSKAIGNVDTIQANDILNQSRVNVITDTFQANDIMNQSRVNVITDTFQANDILNQSRVNVITDTFQANDIMNQSRVNVNTYTIQANDILNQSRVNIITDTVQEDDIMDQSRINVNTYTMQADDIMDQSRVNVLTDTVQANDIMNQSRVNVNTYTMQADDIMDQSEAIVEEGMDQSNDILVQTQTEIVTDAAHRNDTLNQSQAIINKETVHANVILNQSQIKVNRYTVQPNDILSRLQEKINKITVQLNDILNQTQVKVISDMVQTNNITNQSQADFNEDTDEPNNILNQSQVNVNKGAIQSNDILNKSSANINEGKSNLQHHQTKFDPLRTNSIERPNTQSNGHFQRTDQNSEINKSHLLKIELQIPAGKLSNSVIQVQILNPESGEKVFSLTHSQHIVHPSNVKTHLNIISPHSTLEQTQAPVTEFKTSSGQSVTVSNEAVMGTTQNGYVPVPVRATTDLYQPGTGSHLRMLSSNEQQVSSDLTNSPDHKTITDVYKMPEQGHSFVNLDLNQTTSIDDAVIPDKSNCSQARNQIQPVNIMNEKPQTTTRKSKHNAINTLLKKFYEELCLNRGHYVDGFKYVALANICDSYVRCRFSNEQVIDFKVLKCPFGYFWENSVAACKEADKVSCPTNQCQNKDIHSYAEPGNCRAYWICRRKRSFSKCCPDGMSFHPINRCQNDTRCMDVCPKIVKGKCGKLSYRRLKWLYLEYVSGKGYQCRACPWGTHFNKDICACTFRPFRQPLHIRIQAAEDQCRLDVYLNFDHGLKDISENNIIVSENVGIHNGHAGFNGQSKITILRFKDAPIGEHFIIQLRFKPHPNAHRFTIKKEHLISNCGRRVLPSIDVSISPYENSIHFAVQTTDSKLILKGKYNASSWNDIELRYDGKKLQRIINGMVSSQTLSGRVIPRTTSLTIGFCSPDRGFHGWIDHVKIYECEFQQKQQMVYNSRNHLPKKNLGYQSKK